MECWMDGLMDGLVDGLIDWLRLIDWLIENVWMKRWKVRHYEMLDCPISCNVTNAWSVNLTQAMI